MTDNTQGLDEIRKIVKRYDSLKTKDNPEGNPFHQRNLSLDETVDVLLDWHNKQVEAVLDRLENKGLLLEHSLGATDSGRVRRITEAIEAERNKLKESK